MPTLEELLGEIIFVPVVVDVEAMVEQGIELRLAEAERRDFIASVAAGAPASEAHRDSWRRQRRRGMR